MLKMKTWVSLIGLTLLLTGTVRCASDAEKRERRENAFDVSGSYKASKSSGSDLNMEFEIVNEEGRHNIYVHLNRLGNFTDAERQFLEKHGIKSALVFSHFKSPIDLGRGSDSGRLDGGDNISDDFGETGRFLVCTPSYQYDEENSLSYCLDGSVIKKDKKMQGALSLNWTRQRKVMVDGKEATEFTTDSMVLKFKTDMSLVFYRQYLGSWSGDVYSIDDNFVKTPLSRLLIREQNSICSFETLNTKTLKFGGEVYTLDAEASSQPIDALRIPDYPALQMVFVSPQQRRIVLFGQIWSLGNFTGSITLIEGTQQRDLATFRMKKD